MHTMIWWNSTAAKQQRKDRVEKMNENIQKMMELLSQNEEAMKKLSVISDLDEAYALATSIHGGYTKEEFIEAIKASDDCIDQDMETEDLSKVAGGSNLGDLKRRFSEPRLLS